mgnify:CR=1 FL=1
MRVLAASLLVAATLLQGCTLLGIASTTASISSPKHGWFDVNAKLVEKSEIRRPAVPLNLTLHLRVIVQGLKTLSNGSLPMKPAKKWSIFLRKTASPSLPIEA